MPSVIDFLQNGEATVAWLGLFLYSLVRAAILIASATALYRLPIIWRRKRTKVLPPLTVQKREVRTGLKVLALDAILFLSWIRLDLFRFTDDGNVGSHLVTFAILFVWVELWFYVNHRLMHTRWLYKIHRIHHRAIVPNPLSAFSFSVIERVILFSVTMACILIMHPLLPMTLTGISWYFIFNVVFGVIGHSDVSIYPKSFSRHPILKFLSDPPEHSLHHSQFKVNFGLFLNIFDRMFGTFTDPRLKKSKEIGSKP